MRPIHLLALLPAAGVLIGPFFLNRVTPQILGMPFLLGWLSLNLVLTSVVMAIIFHSDSKAHDDRGTAAEEHV
ncbi:Uncharacterized membrane protein YhjC (plasmid) [Cupriavidus taiwanensis]|uniref:Uncharacterized membrane protein YhjC n=1 Tax=Cupriavidus taiwanensis TaxID=164546 RepID=A0A375IWQ3_9BURK|nr:DUF3311 domain-containing protein [Cupriavidus taiwanensis]SPK70273.1 Uncharacterized membrane protein YhjC [Cupriavidus taiwanensis]SPK77585.1 Uncharacterized membrane protein YhjC [Cupriavidus taiwanensis]